MKGKRNLRTGVNTGAKAASTLKRAGGVRALQRPFSLRPVLQGGAVARSVTHEGTRGEVSQSEAKPRWESVMIQRRNSGAHSLPWIPGIFFLTLSFC